MSVTKGTRVRLDNRGIGTVSRFLQIAGVDSVYVYVHWDNGDESYEWVHNLILVERRRAK